MSLRLEVLARSDEGVGQTNEAACWRGAGTIHAYLPERCAVARREL